MTKFAYAGVAGTDILTKVGHGLVTGAGPGMGTGCGLDPTADYYVIRIDNDTFKLAASQAAALAGTPVVDLTSTGNGFFAVGIPFRRARTYAALEQLKSADLNAIQDAGKASYGVVRSVTFPPVTGNGSGATIGAVAVQLAATGGIAFELPLPMPVGARLMDVTIDAIGNAADDVTVTIAKSNRAGDTVLVAATVWNNVPAANGRLTLDVDETTAGALFATGDMLSVVFSATSGGNIQIFGVTPKWLDWENVT